jgi:hypothetical protein
MGILQMMFRLWRMSCIVPGVQAVDVLAVDVHMPELGAWR